MRIERTSGARDRRGLGTGWSWDRMWSSRPSSPPPASTRGATRPLVVRAWSEGRVVVVVAVVAIVALGALARFSGVNWDAGDHLNLDERYLSIVADNIDWPQTLDGYFDVDASPLSPTTTRRGTYVYGQLPLFATKAVADADRLEPRTAVSTSPAGVSRPSSTRSILLVFLVARSLVERAATGHRWSRPRSTRSRSRPSSTPTSSPPRAGSSSSRSPRSPPRRDAPAEGRRAAPGSCSSRQEPESAHGFEQARRRARAGARGGLAARVVAARVELTGARSRRGSIPSRLAGPARRLRRLSDHVAVRIRELELAERPARAGVSRGTRATAAGSR